jgi:hypothetical protein
MFCEKLLRWISLPRKPHTHILPNNHIAQLLFE